MKTILKYLIISSLNLLFLAVALPADAQRGGGGGGHSGGGGGGGHFGGGGGGGVHFSGGGGHFSGGSRASVAAPRSGSTRVGTIQSRAGGFRGNTRSLNGSRNFVHGNGPGAYGHGGRIGHYGWGRHGGFFYNRGFYGSLYFPWLGFSCGFLPWGYYSFYWDDYPYFLSNGLYYQYDNNEYTVVEPPVGALIEQLPSGAQSIVINGQQYYELDGVYYLPITRDNGKVEYEIAGKDGELNTGVNGTTLIVPKIGDIVTKLPPDCRKVKLNGETLFVSEDGVYYQEITDGNNKKAYKIVGVESDQQ